MTRQIVMDWKATLWNLPRDLPALGTPRYHAQIRACRRRGGDACPCTSVDECWHDDSKCDSDIVVAIHDSKEDESL